MKRVYDERQIALSLRASNRTLGFFAVAVLANGAIVQVFGPWAGPLRQALLLIMLTATVLGLQLGWVGAEPSENDRLGRSDKLVIIAALVVIVGLIVELLGGRHAAILELIFWVMAPITLFAPTIGGWARRRHDRGLQVSDEPE